MTIRNFSGSAIEINQRFNLLTKNIASLPNQTLLATVSTAIHRDILNLGDVFAQIKRLGLRNVNFWIDQPVLGTDNWVESSSPFEMNLSVTASRPFQ